MTPKTFADLPLRQRKRAQTQLALVEALFERLTLRPIEDISTKELARAAGISPATFFNYFPAKSDLLSFYIQVWSLDMTIAARGFEGTSAIDAIQAVFAQTADGLRQHPTLMLEIIAHQSRMPADYTPPGVSEGMRLLRFPDVPDILDLPAGGLQDVLPRLLGQAVANGELPADTDVQALFLGLVSVFFGVPLVLARTSPEAIAPCYQSQLRLLWRGARAGGST